MAHNKVYAVCENYCMEETMTKEQIEDAIDDIDLSNYYNKTEIDTKFSNEPDVLSGTTDPTSGQGKNGDIYIKYS